MGFKHKIQLKGADKLPVIIKGYIYILRTYLGIFFSTFVFYNCL